MFTRARKCGVRWPEPTSARQNIFGPAARSPRAAGKPSSCTDLSLYGGIVRFCGRSCWGFAVGVRSHHPPPLPPQQDFPTKTNTFIYACLGLTAAYRVLRTSRRQSLNLVCGVRWPEPTSSRQNIFGPAARSRRAAGKLSQKDGGLRPPPFWRVSQPPWGNPDPQDPECANPAHERHIQDKSSSESR